MYRFLALMTLGFIILTLTTRNPETVNYVGAITAGLLAIADGLCCIADAIKEGNQYEKKNKKND